MTSFDTLVPGKTMSERESSMHIAALVRENDCWNHAHYPIGSAPAIDSLGIVGAGVMGRIVAASAVGYGIPVVITDQNPAALADVRQAIHRRMAAECMDPGTNYEEQVARLIAVTTNLADVAACDLVVESIVENVTTKRNFYSVLEKLCSDETLIVSNTSTLPIAELAAHLRRPERFSGLHYFPPIGAQKMLEIIPGSTTTEDATARIVQFAEHVGRIPAVVSDGRGFAVNRVLMAYMSAGIRLLMQGVSVQAIDSAALAFGMRMGPIRMYDEVGLDVALQCGWSLSADSETLVARTPIIVRMIKAKQLGCKSGRGFYIHDRVDSGERVGDVNPKALQIIESAAESRIEITPAEIEAAITLPMVIEATKLLEINRAHSAGQLDLAVMCGFGFAASRGGPLYWADQVGAGRIVQMIESLQHLGPHLYLTQSLMDAAKYRRRFYNRDDHDGQPLADATSAVRNLS